MVDEQIIEQQAPIETPQQEQPEVQQQPAPESDSDRNLAMLRREKQRISRELDETKRRLTQYEAQQVRPQYQEQAEEDISIQDDDFVDGKNFKKMFQEQKRLKAELKEFQKKAADAFVDNKIRARYPDFDDIVNVETVRVLAEEDPELAYTLQSSSDSYNSSLLAYKEIKRRGIVPSDAYDTQKKRAQTNLSKPRPIVSSLPQQGKTPLSHANAFAENLGDFTPELRQQLWKEMKASMGQKIGGSPSEFD